MKKNTMKKRLRDSYKKNNRKIVLLLSLCFLFQFSFASTSSSINITESDEVTQDAFTVKGVVKDNKGEALPGVSIIIKGTTTGTITGIDGDYTLNVPNKNSTLVFSYMGFQTQEVPVNGQTSININLTEDIRVFDELVVVGYGTMKKREVTSSVETITSKDFKEGGSRNPLDLIQGKVAGLNMTRTQGSNPNAGVDIQLRGVSSLTGNRSPLIVIDGVPGGSLDLLQQDDVESISVLKDGSAAAIYGTRANAGVILITTKKGKSGKAEFNYSSYLRHEVVNDRPDIMSASDYRKLIAEGVINKDQNFGANTDLFNELLNKGNLSHYHNFSMTGGTEATTYRASLFYSDLKGVVKQNGREQYGGRVHIQQKGLDDHLTMSVNLSTNFNKANMLGGSTGDFSQAIQRNPTAPLKNEDGTFFETHAFDNYNPMSRLANRISKRDQQTTLGDLRADLKIIDGLSLSAIAAFQRDTYNDRYFRSINDWDQRPGSQYQGMAYASKNNYLKKDKSFEATANYRKMFAEEHVITALLGYSYQYQTREEFSVNNNGFTTDGFLDWNLGAGSAIQNDKLPRPGMGSNKWESTLVGFFGRINYSFADRYFLQFILRREGSSKFGKNHKWGNFPAASAGWTISEERFMQNVDFVKDLKLRVGYGVTGNEGISPYQSMHTLSTGGVYPQDGVYYQTYGASRNANPDLKWEQKREFNAGLDFSILNHRITGSFDFFVRNTKDLLYEYNAQQPSYIHSRIWANVGTLRSTGFEFQLSGVAIEKENFKWTIDLVGSTLNNKLTKLSSDLFKSNWLSFYGLPSPGNLGDAIRLEEGGKIGNFYGKRFAGFTDDGEWLFYKKDGSKVRAGETSEEDLAVIGNGVPKFQGSINQRFEYKGFDLSLMFRTKLGFDILNLKDLYYANKKWLPNNMLKQAVKKYNHINDDPQYSDYYIEKGNFIKLDNMTLGYTFDFDIPMISHLRLYATVSNLFTISSYSGKNPEVQDTGFEAGIDKRDYYPGTTSWTVGLNVTF